MAGDWIKMRVDLAEDPAVIEMALALGVDEYGIVGRLHKLWSWADKHCSDGHAKSVTNVWIDRYIGHAGFADAVSKAGWLVLKDGGIEFPKFDRHNGASAKNRMESSERKRLQRERERLEQEGQVSQKSCDKSVTREEKRREEKDPSDAAASDEDFLEEDRRKKRAPSDEDFQVARWVFEAQKKLVPDTKIPKWAKWADDIRLMREVDGHTHRSICELFKWAKGDTFWSPNIQSPGKLREKWGTLAEKKLRAEPEVVEKKKDWI